MVPAWVLAPERSYSWRAQTCLSLTSCTWCWTYFPAKVISTGDWIFLGKGRLDAVGGTPNPQKLPMA